MLSSYFKEHEQCGLLADEKPKRKAKKNHVGSNDSAALRTSRRKVEGAAANNDETSSVVDQHEYSGNISRRGKRGRVEEDSTVSVKAKRNSRKQ